MMQKVQRFGGAMFTPVIMFGVFGIFVGIAILCKNPMILGSIAEEGTAWWDFWYIVEQGSWTVFNQMALLFCIGLPIGLAKKENARAAMEAFLIFMLFNYFIQAMMTLWGPDFGVDFSKPAGAGTGLTMIANIKTLDTGIVGAIIVSSIAVWLHGKLFDVNVPDYLGIFKGSSLVVVAGFGLMIPVAFLFCMFWPKVQMAISSLQVFLTSAGVFGVWLYTFLERFLIPTGLHHFIYLPFIFGPAIVDNGLQAYWLEHIREFAESTKPLIELYPQGGFSLHGNSKLFGCPGIALAIYATAKPDRRKRIGALVFPAAAVAVFCGITEPLEFTFLFIAPALFAVHAVLAATLAATMYTFGVTGNFGGGLLDAALFQNWIPLWANHSGTYITQIAIGLCFTVIYFFVFRFLIIHFDFKTPGRGDDAGGDKLYTKADYKAREGKGGAGGDGAKVMDERDFMAAAFLKDLGGKANIVDVTNCATRLRVTVKDDSLVKDVGTFNEHGAHGLVHNGRAIQVIVGLSVPQVRERFENLLNSPDADIDEAEEEVAEAMILRAVVSGKVIDITDVPDEMFAQKMMGDGVGIQPTGNTVVAPADAEVTMVAEESLHAVGLHLKNGADILIHIGIDTVNMKGKGFKAITKQGAKVKEGDPLIKFDSKAIKDAGYKDVVIIAVTNSTNFPKMEKHLGDAEGGKTPMITNL
ncbi:MAG: PTS transporter subunit EIIC [Selenomonadaceae bacterium]|nr:PTS transporter subunit EIIC [Selenomonadaceae bacterium]